MTDEEVLERYELLCDRQGLEDIVSAADRLNGGYYRTRSIKSGTLLEVQAYPMPPRSARRAMTKLNPTGEAQRNLNRKNAERKLIRLAEANFGESDYYFTGTIEGVVPTVDECQKYVRAFIRRWKRAREKKGLTSARYIYVIEGWEDENRKKRAHWHALLEGGLDRTEVKALWDKGRSRCDELDARGNDGLIPLSRYMCKDPRGKRRWAASKGLKKPVIRTADKKVSSRAAKRVASDVAGRAAALEKLYPGYELIDCEISANPYIAGVYIYAVMRRQTGRGKT